MGVRVRALVTGAAGFVGQHLVRHLQHAGDEVTGVDRTQARHAIEAAAGSVRTAIVMVKTGLSMEDAQALLATHDNRVRAVLGDPPPVDDR